MNRNSIFLKNNIFFFLIGLFVLFVPQFVFALDIVVESTVSISARVGSGGTGGDGGEITLPTTVNFSGMAYPYSKVYILQDGNIAATTTASQLANFSASISGLNTNTYTFSVYAEDENNRKSSFFSFPIYITRGTTVNIDNIFLSPTIDVDKSEVKRGDNLVIFGKSIPQKEVVISVLSGQEYLYRVMSNTMGFYTYNLDTSVLSLGKNETKAKNTFDNRVGLYSNPVSFLVGNENKPKDYILCSLLRGDLNCDNHVNLIDFSIMAYWYQKTNPPQKVDLSSDGKINLVDFSILAFNWTG